jgi:chromosome partitioning protein
MGTVFAIANQKGGVGKTTTAVNVAASIADAGYETLLVDLDPQCNATVGVGLAKDLQPSSYDCLSGDLTIADAATPTPFERLWAVPATPDLAGATVELPRISGSETRLREQLGDVRDRFLFTILDCPPSLGPLTVNALVAADRVLVPVQTEYFALEGLAGLLDTLALIQRDLNPSLTVAGMVLTMHDGRTRLAQDVLSRPRLRDRNPAQRQAGRGSELWSTNHSARSAECRIGRISEACEGGCSPCLTVSLTLRLGAEGWAAASPPSCRPRRTRPGCARSPSA